MSLFAKKINGVNNGTIKLIEKIIQNPDNLIEYESNTIRDLDKKPTSTTYQVSVKSKDGAEIVKIQLINRYKYDSKFQTKPSSHTDSYLVYINGKHTYLDDKKADKLFHIIDKERTAREANRIKTPKEQDKITAFLRKFVRE